MAKPSRTLQVEVTNRARPMRLSDGKVKTLSIQA